MVREPPCYSYSENLTFMVYGGIQMTRHLFIYNIRRIARLLPTVHYALNLRDAARNEFERNVERRYNFRCRRKPKGSEKTCAGKYGSRTKFTHDSGPTGNRTRAAIFFSVVNICIELSLYAVAVRFLDFRFFLL